MSNTMPDREDYVLKDGEFYYSKPESTSWCDILKNNVPLDRLCHEQILLMTEEPNLLQMKFMRLNVKSGCIKCKVFHMSLTWNMSNHIFFMRKHME